MSETKSSASPGTAKIITCIVCGRRFEATSRHCSICSPECRRERINKIQREAYARNHAKKAKANKKTYDPVKQIILANHAIEESHALREAQKRRRLRERDRAFAAAVKVPRNISADSHGNRMETRGNCCGSHSFNQNDLDLSRWR